MGKVPHADGAVWYVTFRKPGENHRPYVRNSVRFETELEAQLFSARKLAEGCDVCAGTINPHRPRRTISLSQMENWLGEGPAADVVGRVPSQALPRDNIIVRANIDHYIDMLHNHEVLSQNRTTIQKLLLEEEDKLAHDLEQLEFAETRATTCRDRVDRQRRLLDSFEPSSVDWVQAERLLVNFESLAQFVESFCQKMRQRVNKCQP